MVVGGVTPRHHHSLSGVASSTGVMAEWVQQALGASPGGAHKLQRGWIPSQVQRVDVGYQQLS